MKSHEIESEIQFLFDSVEFGSDRYYDLDKGPEYVCDQIVADIDKQNFSDLKVLVLMVMKSYLKAGRREEMKPFVSRSAIKLTDTYGLLTKFFDEYVEKGASCKTNEEANKILAKTYIAGMQQIFGDEVLMLDVFAGKKNESLKNALATVAKAEGYTLSPRTKRLASRPVATKAGQVADGKYQDMLLKKYEAFTFEFLRRFDLFVSEKMDKAVAVEFLELIKSISHIMESRMSEATKHSTKGQVAIEMARKAIEHIDWQLETTYIVEEERLPYYQQVQNAISRYKKGQHSEKDKQTLDLLMDRIGAMHQLLAWKDENGYRRPANFYVVSAGMTAQQTKNVLKALETIGYAKTEAERASIRETKTLLSMCFDTLHVASTTPVDVERALDIYRTKIVSADGRQRDYASPEAYAKYCATVEEWLEKFDIPHYEEAIRAIGYDIVQEREPIVIPEKAVVATQAFAKN